MKFPLSALRQNAFCPPRKTTSILCLLLTWSLLSLCSSSNRQRPVRLQPTSQPPPLQPQPQSYFTQNPYETQPPQLTQAYQPAQGPPHLGPPLAPQNILAPQPQTTPSQSRKRKADGSAPIAAMPAMSAMCPTGQGEPSDMGQQAEEPAEASTQMPAPKKSRTNTPWSPAEEQRLKIMRDAQNNWGEIAKVGKCHP